MAKGNWRRVGVCLFSWWKAKIKRQRNPVIRKFPMILLGMCLGGQVLAARQLPAPQIVLEQKPVASPITAFRAESVSFLPSQDHENSLAYWSLSRTYKRDDRLERLSPIVKVKTLIFTSSSLPLVQLWDGKVQLEAFRNTLRIQNVQIGSMGYGEMPNFRVPQQTFPDGSRSVHLSGLSLNFHFGRVERTRRPTQTWRCVPRIAAALLR
jgi:hypothetical protein